MKIFSYKTMLNETGNPYIIKETCYNVDGRKKFQHPDDIRNFVCNSLGIQNCAEEYVYVLCFDNAGHLIGCFELAHGTVSASLISTRELFQKALMVGAVCIALTHNHPGNDPTPSKQDIEVTKKINAACEIMDVKLLDHIIVTRDNYVSMKECKFI